VEPREAVKEVRWVQWKGAQLSRIRAAEMTDDEVGEWLESELAEEGRWYCGSIIPNSRMSEV